MTTLEEENAYIYDTLTLGQRRTSDTITTKSGKIAYDETLLSKDEGDDFEKVGYWAHNLTK